MTFFLGTYVNVEKRSKGKTKLFFLILFVHFLFVLFLSYSHKSAYKNPVKKKLIVKTISPSIENTRPSPSVPTLASSKEKQSTPKIEAKKTVKAPEKNRQAKKNTKPPQEKSKEKPDYSYIRNLAKQLEESVAKMEKDSKKPSMQNTLPVPISMAPLQENQALTSEINEKEAVFYQQHLVKYLQHALHLPEYGNVKIALTLNPDGTVMKLEVIAAESEKNRTFLEKSVPQIKFPSFSKSDGKEQKTFLLTFCNE